MDEPFLSKAAQIEAASCVNRPSNVRLSLFFSHACRSQSAISQCQRVQREQRETRPVSGNQHVRARQTSFADVPAQNDTSHRDSAPVNEAVSMFCVNTLLPVLDDTLTAKPSMEAHCRTHGEFRWPAG